MIHVHMVVRRMLQMDPVRRDAEGELCLKARARERLPRLTLVELWERLCDRRERHVLEDSMVVLFFIEVSGC